MGIKFFCFVLLNIYASLAQQSNVAKIFYAETGDDVVFPCLPTSPEQKVKLLMDGAELELDDRLIYDPKVGFTMELVTSADSGRYQCVNKEGTEELNFYVDVKENCNVTAMEKPTRIRYSVKHLVEDGELRINCAGLKPSTGELKPKITDCLNRSSIELRYQNFTKQDEGLYRCNIENTIYSYVRVTMEDAKEKYKKLETVEIPMDAEDPEIF
ncbi:hypothetical protein G9C98_007975 [Cotesia typhae]|uniref:Immunoglobulin domain-containing protein n=1 Tax=Cotesia typhae TaxID=2053667 RepID=A0A8J5R9J5_9HYME|nr:hypothetical protein G9C98_007975 [Cotesia typhae]